ncbi:MAG: hypothetical protein OSB62_03210 [Alphaproteobacteria bacterium]|nr:hypothetical protein [Alphaproteobacteria bacterium]
MSTLTTLHKVAKQATDEKQRQIAEILAVIRQMEVRKEELLSKADTEHDAALAAKDAFLLSQAGLFAEMASAEIKDIDEATTDAEAILVERREELTEIYAEQRRYEILLERKAEEARKLRAKKQQDALDEVAATMFANQS